MFSLAWLCWFQWLCSLSLLVSVTCRVWWNASRFFSVVLEATCATDVDTLSFRISELLRPSEKKSLPVSLMDPSWCWEAEDLAVLWPWRNKPGPSDLGFLPQSLGFPGGASGKEPVCQCWRHKRLGFHPWVRKIPWRRAWQPTPVFLPGESLGQRSLVGCSPLESQRVEQGWSDFARTHACTEFTGDAPVSGVCVLYPTELTKLSSYNSSHYFFY